ncbi:MAG: hypothetical protein GY805_38785, partial [Chloroflexi bacterium]|nr:hypothetical protein [Chloroflexota bacterium]
TVALNDDYVIKDSHLHKDTIGLVTHHADSYLTTKLPKNGTYYLHLSDSQNHGSKNHAYRLRISPPQPDFALRITPPSCTMRPGDATPVNVHALRKDGFNGDIKITLKDPPEDFQLTGNTIPAGTNSVRMTISAPPIKSKGITTPLKFIGTANIKNKKLTRQAIPSQDLTQAFLYRHLVPSQQFIAKVLKSKWIAPKAILTNATPLQLSLGGQQQLDFKFRKNPKKFKKLQLQLDNPPAGITLSDTKVTPTGLTCKINIANEMTKKQFKGNLIIEAFTTRTPKQKNGKQKKPQRNSAGYFPAIPIIITK